ncbi:hypothetical protein CHGG_09809 [Chaetomium globosum CBS 148.51]|uniref:Transcription elongation factor SPT5 n=1 Tax=Chaetomium globosum (strain ATCC 6205 / CBS 148.51 / DSM 1962 / NBRC 6347 / NRRL 1970) TaxID=306901 RepID=Q2GQE5_CHAGB|nr:uncharacterized protein CHGG_09809 [Chaetomium globosum CBS 148.51]EAQ83405.1 hypothetical protein CHGG_09809 [Chaetomium globosum CBS 148.51]
MASSAPFQFAGDSESEDDNFNPAPAEASDDEDGAQRATGSSDRRARSPDADDDQNEDDEDEERPSKSGSKRARDVDDEEDNEDEEEDEEEGVAKNGYDEDEEEEEEEEEEDDDDDVQHRHRRKRRKDHRAAFFDIEAEVEDEDEAEDEEKEGEEIEDFIDNAHPDDIAESGHLDDDRRHRELDRRREIEASMDAEKQAEILRARYGKRAPARGYGEMTVVPKRLLLPSVDDPSIWAVRCKEGKERDVIFSIMRRIEERAGGKDALSITSAFERGGTNSVMKGYIYVEARRQNDIMIALDGVLDVYPRTKMVLVELKDMPDLLRVMKTPNLEPGAWVRLKKPAKYAGDLAQVLDVTENGLEARVRYIPRLDYGVRDEILTGDGKRKRPGMPGPRPPQRLFSEVEARKRQPRQIQGNPQTNTWIYNGDDFENGFLVKDIKIQQLDVKDVNPTLEEVTKFASGSEDGTENLDLKALAASLKDSNTNVAYVPGDVIEVYEGEQRGVVGKVANVQGDIVTLRVTEGDLAGQTIEVPNKGLRKLFKTGDHVKVIGGSRFRDEVGMIVKIVDDRITLLTDQTNTEVTVFSKDLREASDIGGQGSIGQYSLLDLVQLDPTTVACIVKVDRESMVVWTRTVIPDSNATTENAGVFVTRAGNVSTIAAKGGRATNPNSGPDLSAMNPALKRNPAQNQAMQPPKTFGRDRALGQTVSIRRGGYKALMGIVKDTSETHARVELHGKNKIVSIAKADLIFKDRVTGKTIDIYSRSGRGGFGGGAGRGGFGAGDRPGGSRTPMGAGGGERTPAWGAPKGEFYLLPCVQGLNANYTPAHDGFGHGSKTPAYGAGNNDPWGSKTPAYGVSAPTPGASGADSWGYTPGASGGAYDAPTPGAGLGAPTPAALNAPTPGAYSAPTPAAVGAPTPGAWQGGWGADTAPTPAAGAPTPAASGGYYSAPTPAAYGGAPETPAASGEIRYADDD